MPRKTKGSRILRLFVLKSNSEEKEQREFKVPVAPRCNKCPLKNYCSRGSKGKNNHKPIPKNCREAIKRNLENAARSVN